MTKSVGIIGCGWLGIALAKKLIAASDNVLATTAHTESSDKLSADSIPSHPLSLPSQLSTIALAKTPIFSMSQLVICLPPRIKSGQSDYPDKIKQIVAAAEIAKVEHIILISSTAVYGGLSGKVDEASQLNFSAPKVQIMHDAEQAVLNFSQYANVIRLAGLVGPNRHPGRFLSSSNTNKLNDKKLLANPFATVNLIHQTDAVSLINTVLNSADKQQFNKDVFNGVSNTHVSRKDFYQAAAQALNLAVPEFVDEQDSSHGMSKEVLGDKAVNQLKVSFVYNDLVQWVRQGILSADL